MYDRLHGCFSFMNVGRFYNITQIIVQSIVAMETRLVNRIHVS